MISRPGADDWDFGPVFELLHSLSFGSGEHGHREQVFSDPDSDPPEQATYTPATRTHDQERQLGDFDIIWQYLGQPLDLPAPTVTNGPLPSFVDVWDGQPASEQRTVKVVRWHDDIDCANLADNDEKKGALDLSNLTKQQRKKAKRKQRHEEQEALAAKSVNGKSLPNGSEDESGKDLQELKTADRAGVIYQLLHGTPPPPGTGRLRSGKPFRSQNFNDFGALPAAASSSANQIVQILKPVRDNALEVAAAKKKKLMSMLNESFIDDRQYLCNLSFTRIVANGTDTAAEGIHVFIDASNVRSDQSTVTASWLIKHPDNDRVSRCSQNGTWSIHCPPYAPPAPLLPQPLFDSRTRPAHCQTHRRRLRQLPRYGGSKADRIRNQYTG